MVTRRKLDHLRQEDGFVFLVTAVSVTIILGLSVLYLSNSVSLNITEAADVYSVSQSYWSAISGIEYSLQQMVEGAGEISGNYPFYNSGVSIAFSGSDRFGAPLSSDQVRVVSTGVHGVTKRIFEVTFEVADQDVWPDLSVIQEIEHHEFEIKKEFTLNDSLYIGGDVDVHHDASIGEPPGERTTIFVPTGKEVEGDFDEYFSWAEYPEGSLEIPELDRTKYDSLIAIAEAITSTSGNKHKGDYTVNGGTFDLSGYQDYTFFVKGKVTIRGAVVTGGTVPSPGIIVATKEIKMEKKGGTQTTIGDNIIVISDDKIELKDRSQFGVDYSSLDPASRPKTVNEMYAKKEIRIEKDTEIWAEVITTDKLEIKGKVYGLAYSGKEINFDESSSFLEGALFTLKVEKPKSKLEKGKMDLNHYFPLHYFSGIKYQFVPHSLREI